MNIEEYCQLQNYPLPADDVLLASAFLEGWGFQFLKDYSFSNAIEIAERVMQQEIARNGREWGKQAET